MVCMRRGRERRKGRGDEMRGGRGSVCVGEGRRGRGRKGRGY